MHSARNLAVKKFHSILYETQKELCSPKATYTHKFCYYNELFWSVVKTYRINSQIWKTLKIVKHLWKKFLGEKHWKQQEQSRHLWYPTMVIGVFLWQIWNRLKLFEGLCTFKKAQKHELQNCFRKIFQKSAGKSRQQNKWINYTIKLFDRLDSITRPFSQQGPRKKNVPLALWKNRASQNRVLSVSRPGNFFRSWRFRDLSIATLRAYSI